MIRPKGCGLASIRAFTSAASLTIALLGSTGLSALGQSGTWTTTGTLNTPRSAHTATLLVSGQVLVVGGKSGTTPLASAELYNPATGRWTLTGSMSTPRFQHTATLLPNGEVLVAGGETGGVDSTATAEVYNPTTGAWKTTGSMTVPRALHGVALLQNGQVLVAGGTNAAGTSNLTAELYSPTTGAWKATGSMPTGQNSPATLLANGKVLVAGGDTAELYDPHHWAMDINAGPVLWRQHWHQCHAAYQRRRADLRKQVFLLCRPVL